MIRPADPPETRPWRRRIRVDVAYTPSVFVVLAGVWLISTSLPVGDRSVPRWHDVGAGVLIMMFALARVLLPRRTAGLGVVNAAVGGFLTAAPFVLGFSHVPGATWNDIIVGILVVLFAGVGALAGEGHR